MDVMPRVSVEVYQFLCVLLPKRHAVCPFDMLANLNRTIQQHFTDSTARTSNKLKF
jgi:hypothetical protein